MSKIIVAILSVLLLVGCASMNDVKINESFDKAIGTHDIEQTKVVQSKAQAITSMFDSLKCDDGSEACGTANALIVVVASDKISMIKTQDLLQPRPITSLEVQEKALEVAGSAVMPVITGVVAVKAIDSDRGDTKISSSNGSTVSNSYDEDHATSLGDNTNSTNSAESPSSTTTGE